MFLAKMHRQIFAALLILSRPCPGTCDVKTPEETTTSLEPFPLNFSGYEFPSSSTSESKANVSMEYEPPVNTTYKFTQILQPFHGYNAYAARQQQQQYQHRQPLQPPINDVPRRRVPPPYTQPPINDVRRRGAPSPTTYTQPRRRRRQITYTPRRRTPSPPSGDDDDLVDGAVVRSPLAGLLLLSISTYAVCTAME